MGTGAADVRLPRPVAADFDACDQRPGRRPGHPPADTSRGKARPRRFLHEGTPWRSPAATADQAGGPTLRRCLERWAAARLLAQVHALPAGMPRGRPDLIPGGRAVGAERGGGDLSGPDPPDRARQAPGTMPRRAAMACRPPFSATATKGKDALASARPRPAAFAVIARIRMVFAGKGRHGGRTRGPCRRVGADPRIHRRGRPRGAGLRKRR
ncbi:hypothetical protein E2C06_03210 [Dankookia rubra]|uniref:Uncharacterized protein n=1 Tax=Dankookia rubra TaxID=1442381 RepID=A0A4R5QK93_9PROT|nr:hypothetical protein [Dankookia rubra]TDH63864.1 hypothetical protein E2C06_03210 [Dankookia rubra]